MSYPRESSPDGGWCWRTAVNLGLWGDGEAGERNTGAVVSHCSSNQLLKIPLTVGREHELQNISHRLRVRVADGKRGGSGRF